jgi:hypothetical protein
MKKSGSMLIEVIASIMILTLTSTFIVSTSIQNFNILKERMLEEDVSRSISNLINEFKYNMTKKEVEEMLNDKIIGLKYNEDFSNKLTYAKIKDFEQGDDIEISKINEDSFGLNLKIVANIRRGKNEVNLEKEFTKSWWMGEA